MYDIRQFKPALYALLLLGMSGYAVATQSPGVWVLSVGAILLNAWLVRTGRFRPIPRFVANLVTLAGLMLMVSVVRRGTALPILVIGQFLVLLQVVKLFEQRANRDLAQLLVLSLLLMVAAAISTASLLFGLMFILYLFLSLYCCLLFHLKVETDHARQAIGIPEDRLNPATLRQDQTYLSRSMRRLTGLVSIFSITTAIVTFLLFPRGTGAGLLGPMQFRAPQAMTGFNDSVSFQNVARLTQNPREVAWIKITKGDAPYRSAQPLLLRGLTLDRYSGNGDEGGNAYQWTRNVGPDTFNDEVQSDRPPRREGFPAQENNDQLTQSVTLDPTGTSVLFALGGISAFKPAETARFRYCRDDEVLQYAEQILQRIRYEVASSGKLTMDESRFSAMNSRAGAPTTDTASGSDTSDDARPIGPPRRSRVDPKIEAFARQPDVAGNSADGRSLAAQRSRDAFVTPLDAAIARNIESYLQKNFTYTLDLTDARRIEGQDPMVAFLYDLKRGHCEYFAGAMTLMCQSLGMQARMVIGFKCDEYNTVGDYYTVRQSHAHAWVEVLDSAGVWQTYDPTSGRDAPTARHDGIWQRVRYLMSFLEYTWANTVIAYDRDSRKNVLDGVQENLTQAVGTSDTFVARVSRWLDDSRYLISSNVIAGVIALMASAIVVCVGWYSWERFMLRRRARRIGLDTLPQNERLKLARQLGFYDYLVRLLERRQIYRQAHLTPLEFSDSLTFLPVTVFDAIRRLTETFYMVRYGRAELNGLERRHLMDIIADVEHSLDGSGAVGIRTGGVRASRSARRRRSRPPKKNS